MTIVRAHQHNMERPWGVVDLKPWGATTENGCPVGEIWYKRPEPKASTPSLLLKLLFTSQPLSIQVHPDDAFARAIGLANGKTEAWYVLSAGPEARVALGLERRCTSEQLRQAVHDGTIAKLVAWKPAVAGDVVFVPAGTIHAIGAGLVIAEIQQRSDATFRLFDHGRKRELHIDNGLAAANTVPADEQALPSRPTNERTLLVSCPHFVLERIELPPDTSWCLEAERETWCLVLSGRGHTGSYEVTVGDVVFAQSDRVNVVTGTVGMTLLLAYSGVGPIPHLLQRLKPSILTQMRRPKEGPAPPTYTQASNGLAHEERGSEA